MDNDTKVVHKKGLLFLWKNNFFRKQEGILFFFANNISEGLIIIFLSKNVS